MRDRRSIQLQRTRVSELSAERVEIKERRKSCELHKKPSICAETLPIFHFFFIFALKRLPFSFLLSLHLISLSFFLFFPSHAIFFSLFSLRLLPLASWGNVSQTDDHRLELCDLIGRRCALLSFNSFDFFSIVCEIESKQNNNDDRQNGSISWTFPFVSSDRSICFLHR